MGNGMNLTTDIKFKEKPLGLRQRLVGFHEGCDIGSRFIAWTDAYALRRFGMKK